MDYTEFFSADCSAVGFNPNSKKDAIKGLAELAGRHIKLKDIPVSTIYQKLMDRENQGTTGFGDEIAIPHARIEGLDQFIILIAVSNKGVDFASLDKKKVKVFFVILGPAEQVDVHVQILAYISGLLRKTGIKKELISSNTVQALKESLFRNTSLSSGKKKKMRKMKLMYVILYIEEFLYDILEYFLEEGIDGATVFDSFGMGEYISNIPIFANFIGFMNENKNQSKTIIALIPDEKINRIVSGIEEITGNLDKKQGAMIFTVNIDFFKGTMRMM